MFSPSADAKTSKFLPVALPGVEFLYAYIWASATKVHSRVVLALRGDLLSMTHLKLALGILSCPSTLQKIVRSEVHGLFGALTLPVSCFYFVFGLWGFLLHYYRPNSILKYILKYNFSQSFKVFVRRRSLVFSLSYCQKCYNPF